MKKILSFILLVCVLNISEAKQTKEKPRVIEMTDGEIDDHSSMIRFLLYTCDIELLAIIETNSVFQRNGHSDELWLEKQLDAYEQVYPNLIIHNPDYPSANKIRSVCFIGDEDENHLKAYPGKPVFPGKEVIYKPDNWNDTPGSDRIVEVLLEKDNRPVHIQAWGGGNTAARAFYKLKSEYPSEYERAVSKVVMYNIWYQDGAGNYIETYHPKVKMLFCGSFSGTWNYGSQKNTQGFIENNVKNHHGPLGALYPQDYVSEGDSPAFLYSVASGLRNNEEPGYGGWGGRFSKLEGFENVYIDALDDKDIRKSLQRWIRDANSDFQARMDWGVSSSYQDANHPAVIMLKGENNITVKSGEKVKLNAKKSSDPDGDAITFAWWQYKEAGTYEGVIEINHGSLPKAEFIAPKVNEPKTIHIILNVKDNGKPILRAYQRVIVNVIP
ncbi:MAG TPA: nucleoside hydrolase-like domain-containing protein [Bacteroidales bacterium]|nr:nucleoside hydrolase-like domain-containing protein [Bacteroidales bacterium]